jgi:general stress protein 26
MRNSLAAVLLFTAGLAPTAAAQAVQPDTVSPARVVAAARDVIEKAGYATFVTIGGDGQPQARIVDPFVPEADFTIWIGTNSRTRKVADIGRDPRVTLTYFNAAAGAYVTVIGMAALVADSAEKAGHWKEAWSRFYANGPRGDDYLLIRVRPTRLEVVSPRHGLVNDPVTWRPVTADLP